MSNSNRWRPLASLLPLLLLAQASLATLAITSTELQKGVPALPLSLYRHLRRAEQQQALALATPTFLDDASSQLTFAAPAPAYQAHYFDQLISHDPEVPPPAGKTTFRQRYWFDAGYYKKGGPVFLLDGGETDGAGRLPFLKEGILRILSEATGGIGIVFEHRYYGESFPVDDLSTDSFRYLTTMQSLQDGAYFAENVKLPGLEDVKLTPNKHAAWFYYGGSYAGAKAAFARKLFPDVWWGAIASSAVTAAIVDYWEYYEPIRLHAPSACIDLLQNHTSVIDSLLALDNPLVTTSLKSYFGLPNITLDTDFVNALSIPLGSWQARNWDSEVGSSAFFDFCDTLTADPEEVTKLGGLTTTVLEFVAQAFPSWPKDPRKTFASFSAYAAYSKDKIASMCPEDEEQDDCFGTDAYGGDGLEEAPWKSWSYQFCTEWGYFMGGAPEGHPSIVSRLIGTDYTAQICEKAFPPGKLNSVPSTPNTTAINQWGSFKLQHSRLAFIDGSDDPWLYATPHSPHAPNRTDTIKRPFKVISGGVHHWDENGRLDGDVPKAIRKVHEDEVEFVKAWVKEWEERGRWKTGAWRD
ncbi:serine carboxypeptidase S28-domain-containing protein [Leucosporidium creatinivorum]|uniref:Serine carboxypeptidase S28-domain-containing protein n=1 Tax=Leucosporidium creatinivorum TaxID=106004 RepID=A0A1Y2FI35_9BASI|nr:serine carboxypeptidase S28-domain-containing protein [Leucosporidium creatinivorum]